MLDPSNFKNIICKTQENGRVIVFVEKQHTADYLCRFLTGKNYKSVSIHGKHEQWEREEAMKEFRKGRARILVATSIAARGLDIPQIHMVINYDMPKDISTYTHRIGRTGRAGHEGLAITYMDHESRGVSYKLVTLLRGAKQEVPQWLSDLSGERFKRRKRKRSRSRSCSRGSTRGKRDERRKSRREESDNRESSHGSGQEREINSAGVCFGFQKGSCKFGNRCKFSHDGSKGGGSSNGDQNRTGGLKHEMGGPRVGSEHMSRRGADRGALTVGDRDQKVGGGGRIQWGDFSSSRQGRDDRNSIHRHDERPHNKDERYYDRKAARADDRQSYAVHGGGKEPVQKLHGRSTPGDDGGRSGYGGYDRHSGRSGGHTENHYRRETSYDNHGYQSHQMHHHDYDRKPSSQDGRELTESERRHERGYMGYRHDEGVGGRERHSRNVVNHFGSAPDNVIHQRAVHDSLEQQDRPSHLGSGNRSHGGHVENRRRDDREDHGRRNKDHFAAREMSHRGRASQSHGQTGRGEDPYWRPDDQRHQSRPARGHQRYR